MLLLQHKSMLIIVILLEEYYVLNMQANSLNGRELAGATPQSPSGQSVGHITSSPEGNRTYDPKTLVIGTQPKKPLGRCDWM